MQLRQNGFGVNEKDTNETLIDRNSTPMSTNGASSSMAVQGNGPRIKSEKVYRPGEIAEALRISTVTVTRAIRNGHLKAFRAGRQWRILGSEVSRYINEQTKSAMLK